MYQMWCQVQPPSPHQPTTSRPCPQSKRWPRTQTAAALTHWRGHWMRVSEHIPRPRVCLSACSPFTISKHQPSPFFLFFTPSYPHFVCLFVSFLSWVFSSFLLNLNEKVYFSIFFLCVTFILLILFNFTLCVRTAGQRRSKLSLWILLNLIKYVWCTHPHGFSGYQESVGGGVVVCSVCLYLNSFIFLANVKLRPEVIVIKLEQNRTDINHSCQLLMHVTPIRTKADHKSTALIWFPSEDQTPIQSLIDPLASSQYCRSPQLCFLHSVFCFVSLT